MKKPVKLSGTKIFWLFAVALIAITGLSLTGCETTSTSYVQKVNWSDYTFIPSKDYTVVGAVVIRLNNARSDSFNTMNADLMDRAIAMGGHDIINVRLDREEKILAVSAVVIKYTNETLKNKIFDRTNETSHETYLSGSSASSSIDPGTNTNKGGFLSNLFN